MELLIFYVYLWLRYNGTPYYVGKGKGRRGFTSEAHSVRCPSEDRIIIQYYETEEEALEAEKFFIAYYGRNDLGAGILWNHTDGGEGLSNPSQETLSKMGAAQKRKWEDPEYRTRATASSRGRKYSPEAKVRRIDVQKAMWDSPGYREMQSAAHNRPWTAKRRAAFKGTSKETLEKMSALRKKEWEAPGFRERRAASLKEFFDNKPSRMSDCHPERKHWVKGMCRSCYEKLRRSLVCKGPVKVRPKRMATCHPDRRHKALGLCSPCWQKDRKLRRSLDERRTNS